jgi:hypothetical protein
MATPPDLAAVKAYLGDNLGSWDDSAVEEARLAEVAAQAKACRIPAEEGAYPADLDEALCRRVAHNLALRPLPLGVMANVSDMAVATTRVGGMDPEVRRLEGPYRRVMFG